MSRRCSTLTNGLRIVSENMPGLHSASLGIWVGAGTRAEPAEINGVAHFLEHMAFKGTKTRTALQIASEIEAVGGQLNAYTGRETTAYYARVMNQDVPLALDILADILQNPTFIEEEMDRERGVILQEIGQSYDTPDDIIFDHFQEVAFPDQPMGRPVLGTGERVQAMSRDAIFRFMKTGYHGANLVLAAVGDLDHDQLVFQAQEAFQNLSGASSYTLEPGRYKGGAYRKNRPGEQVHLVMGFPGAGLHDSDRIVVNLVANILGGGMSSRLFQEIREKRGLAYSVYAFASSYADCGLFGIYAGTGAREAAELTPLLCHELNRLGQKVGEEELEMNKAQLRAALVMSQESSANRADRLGTQMLAYGEIREISDFLEKIDNVTVSEIQAMAQKMFQRPLSVAALGPLDHLESYAQIAGRLG